MDMRLTKKQKIECLKWVLKELEGGRVNGICDIVADRLRQKFPSASGLASRTELVQALGLNAPRNADHHFGCFWWSFYPFDFASRIAYVKKHLKKLQNH